MNGFEAGDRELPAPPVGVTDETRATMAKVLVAIVGGPEGGATPEELAGFLEDGFPGWVVEALERPGEGEEFNAHIDVLLSVLQSPAAIAA